ncbi:Stk1 family PASTA domain-containing Ser/Thr kinase [Kribbella speibonae]|uniref:non-specific serine/threonine protein kinase n=1 Tax=Kribbella speibonae TaxID=1572660 RepID=A0A4R0IZG6_9ACTN|nr:Stk1 family PASTA domain-containing Ser/Thr kinase [Kribbella speibonae]TCC38094.1 Stk1 family PASTA domain-containing Ser/Thr kinase [Kribbella speibonae]
MTDDVDTQVSDRLVGRVLDGRYRVGARVAKGGMATVYEALDMRLDRTVALKVMHDGLGDDAQFTRRFVAEARAAARLSNPNVVAVFDQGDDDGTLFLAMEYVRGRTLRDVIREEAPLSPARALDLLTPVLSALSAAHDAGIVHRDIKPENVLISDKGAVKVADFGLARAVSASGNTATQGLLMGTVSYLAPELVTDGSADARSDVYSAGIVLYEMLTGNKPHSGDTPIQVAYAHVHADVPPPSLEQPSIPPYVDALVQRATARDRDLRPTDARVFSRQVHRVRSALDEGLPDDPELTGDLTVPIHQIRQDSGYDDGYTRGEASGEIRHDTIVVPVEHGRPTGAPAKTPPPTKAPPQRQRRSRGPIALIAIVAAAIAIGTGAWYYGIQRYTTTPSLVGLEPAAATARAQESGLHTTLDNQDYSEDVKAGLIIRTDPKAGDRIRKDGEIGLTVSKGPERYRVPQLVGLQLDAAQQALSPIKLITGQIIEQYNETVPQGKVIAISPKFNTVVKPGTSVNFAVSKGKRPITVPDLTGKSYREANKTLRNLGFVVGRSTQYDEKVAEGKVISQSPNNGTLFAKDKVSLVVSLGPPLVEVPDVKKKTTAEAQKILGDAGFKVTVQKAPFNLGLNIVAAQSPGGGRKVKPGSTIVITVL